jgi:hypothetical protein
MKKANCNKCKYYKIAHIGFLINADNGNYNCKHFKFSLLQWSKFWIKQ